MNQYIDKRTFDLYIDACKEAGVATDILDDMQAYFVTKGDKDKDGRIDKKEFAEMLRNDKKFGEITMTKLLRVIYKPNRRMVDFEVTMAGLVEYDKFGNVVFDPYDMSCVSTNSGGTGQGYYVGYGPFSNNPDRSWAGESFHSFPILILAGPPAGGKGTMCKKMAEEYGVLHISTGKMLREAASTDSALATKMARGDLIDDSLVFAKLKAKLDGIAKHPKAVILDGFPRNQSQIDMLCDSGFPVNAFILLEVDDDVVKKRVLGRAESARANGKTPRADDNEQTIVARLKKFHDEIGAMVKCYSRRMYKVNGNNSVAETWKQIKKLLEEEEACQPKKSTTTDGVSKENDDDDKASKSPSIEAKKKLASSSDATPVVEGSSSGSGGVIILTRKSSDICSVDKRDPREVEQNRTPKRPSPERGCCLIL